nr:PREDICTED: uncharacterized protein LOC102201787 [Pundamilia nyererei]
MVTTLHWTVLPLPGMQRFQTVFVGSTGATCLAWGITAPSAQITTGTTVTFTLHIFWSSPPNSWYFSCSFFLMLLSFGVATAITTAIFLCLSTTPVPVDSLVPVETVQLGDPATLTCAIPKELSIRGLKCSLIILETVQEDEGHYHCTNTEWIGTTWGGTYLLVKGKAQRTSNYAVSQLLIESNPVRPGDTMTLQCSVFSDSDKKTYPGDLNILWVREGSDKSLPNIIYTDRNRSNECEKRSDHQKTCVYHFSKNNVSSSDAGTYYCAVATCGEILFGNGITLDTRAYCLNKVFDDWQDLGIDWLDFVHPIQLNLQNSPYSLQEFDG